MTNDRFERQLEKVLDGYLEDYSLEDFLENFNITPFEIVLNAFNSGLIDEEVLQAFLTSED